MSRRRGLVPSVLTCAGVFAVCLLAFPIESDACYANNDGLWFAWNAEHHPWQALKGHHPLFHVLVNGATVGLEALGVARPGHWGVRVISGLGGAALAALVLAAAGAARWWAGALLVLVLVSTRGFLIEGGCGENVLPAAAAGLFALWCAWRPTFRPAVAATALILALLLRQDNVLLIPAWLFALGRRLPREGRARRVLFLLGAGGAATLMAYVAFWRISHPDWTFSRYLLDLSLQAEGGAWSPTAGAITPRIIVTHLGALGFATIGRHGYDPWLHVGAGLGTLAALLAGGALLRGRAPARAFLALWTLVLAARVPFYLWFEPANFEWWVLPVAATAWCAAWLVRDPVRLSLPRRALGAGVLVAAAATLLAFHGPSTWALRGRVMATAADRAMALARGRVATFLPAGQIPYTALMLRGARIDASLVQAPEAEALPRLKGWLEHHPGRPAVLLLDRFVYDGMPMVRRLETDHLAAGMDGLTPLPRDRILRREGRIQAIGFFIRPAAGG